MRIRSKVCSSLSVVPTCGIVFGLIVLQYAASALLAEDGPDKGAVMLEGLKKQSPAERWQRVKRQYPSTQNVQRTDSGTQPVDSKSVTSSDELPPAPATGPVIPRLTALPRQTTNDWIFPARDLNAIPPADASPTAPKSTGPIQAKQVSQRSDAPEPNPPSIESSDRSSSESNPNIGTRSPLERRIGSIAPYYDRERDSDMRSFAIERGKDYNIKFQAEPYSARSFPEINLAWEAPNLYHNPLYFNDPALERYGHTYHPAVQPLMSIARLTVQFVFLPYQMTIKPPCQEEYALGWYRPGECTPKLHYPIPFNLEAAVVEAGVVSGIYFFVIP